MVRYHQGWPTFAGLAAPFLQEAPDFVGNIQWNNSTIYNNKKSQVNSLDCVCKLKHFMVETSRTQHLLSGSPLHVYRLCSNNRRLSTPLSSSSSLAVTSNECRKRGREFRLVIKSRNSPSIRVTGPAFRTSWRQLLVGHLPKLRHLKLLSAG